MSSGDRQPGEDRDEGADRGSTEEDRVAQGVEHLQAAALEMIDAARAFLDVAEEFVADPDKVADAVSAVGALARMVAREGDPPRGRPTPDPDGGDHVEHITLS